MRVYHGSYAKINEIDLSKCRPNRDFGQGFYVTKFKTHAENWAKRKGYRMKTEGVITEFDFVEGTFAQWICKIKRFEGYTEEWLDFIVENRSQGSTNATHEYDIIEGPVADDNVVNRVNDYLNNLVSKKDFLEELKYHEETHQICFSTLAALQTLVPANDNNNHFVTCVIHISESIIVALMDSRKIDENTAVNLFYSSDTFIALTNSNTEYYMKSWQEIYEMLKEELNR